MTEKQSIDRLIEIVDFQNLRMNVQLGAWCDTENHTSVLAALAQAGKHVLVEKPAFLSLADYREALAARDAAGGVVPGGENGHYKPPAIRLRRLLAGPATGAMVFSAFLPASVRLKGGGGWGQDRCVGWAGHRPARVRRARRRGRGGAPAAGGGRPRRLRPGHGRAGGARAAACAAP